jgi:hypothetical protein
MPKAAIGRFRLADKRIDPAPARIVAAPTPALAQITRWLLAAAAYLLPPPVYPS